MICNTIGLTADSFESIYTTGGTEVEEVYGDIDYAQPIYAKIREMTGTLPLTFTSHLAGNLTDYLISGNTVQNGTPSPDMPVDVVGCGVRTENLFDAATTYGSMYDSATGVLVGTARTLTGMKNKFTSSMVGVPITISARVYDVPDTVTRVYIRCAIGGAEIDSNAKATGETGTITVTVTPTSVNDYWKMTFGDGDGNITLSNLMLNLGSTALPYKPYGYKLPTTINSTGYPIYLGQVETTRKIKKLVLTGDENFVTDDYGGCRRFVLPITPKGLPGNNYASLFSHYVYGYDFIVGHAYLNEYGYKMYFNHILELSYSDFKSYLAAQYAAGTPVTVWYVLAEPETGIVNEPLHKIGDYADTISVEQAGVAVPTVSGTNVLDMASTVKPSEVYIKGKGIKHM